jgi:hypothetical protein
MILDEGCKFWLSSLWNDFLLPIEFSCEFPKVEVPLSLTRRRGKCTSDLHNLIAVASTGPSDCEGTAVSPWNLPTPVPTLLHRARKLFFFKRWIWRNFFKRWIWRNFFLNDDSEGFFLNDESEGNFLKRWIWRNFFYLIFTSAASVV